MPANLFGTRIADYYTSLLHVSGADLTSLPSNIVYDGVGNVTGLSLSSAGDRVVINNYIMPEGCPTGSGRGNIAPDCADFTMSSETPRVKDWLNTFYPIGTIMLTTTPNNPGDKIFGTRWVLESSQRFTVGVGSYTDKNNDIYEFSAGGIGQTNGDIAGEYKCQLYEDDLPEHAHITNTGMAENVDAVPGAFAAWFPYFGPPINPEGTTQNNTDYREFQGQGTIVDFQNDTSRAAYIRELYDRGYRYTDADFNPTLGNRSLRGWAGGVDGTINTPGDWTPQARSPIDEAGGVNASGGPGWGGYLYLDSRQEIAQFLDDAETPPELKPIFIGNSPRPVGEQWTRYRLEGTTVSEDDPPDLPGEPGRFREHVRIVTSIDGQRDFEYIHPGELSNDQMIRAFRIVREALRGDRFNEAEALIQARTMFRGVTRVQELQSPEGIDPTVAIGGESGPEHLVGTGTGFSFKNVMIPGYSPVNSQTTGSSFSHNNIPPNYGVYVWRRVQPGFQEEVLVCPVPPVYGCINRNATNYGGPGNDNSIGPPYATANAAPGDPGACIFPVVDVPVKGCTDRNANNFVSDATENDPDNPCTYDPVVVVTPTPNIWTGTIPGNQTELDLCTWAESTIGNNSARGPSVWNGSDEAIITLAGGKYIISDDNSLGKNNSNKAKKPALLIRCFPKLRFNNYGLIMGRGGNGGSKAGGIVEKNGYDGGDAVWVDENANVVFYNYGKGAIAGGGGGGGGSATGDHSGGGGGAGGGWGGTSKRHAKYDFNFTDKDTRKTNQSPAGGSSGIGDGSSLGGDKYSSAGGGAGGGVGLRGGPGVYWWGCGKTGPNKTSIGNGKKEAHAGGSGAGGANKGQGDPCGTGGGGGRKIPQSGASEGGIANEIEDGGCKSNDDGNRGGAGGWDGDAGSSGSKRAGSGGGGWGARGGGSGGAGGYAIRKKTGSASVAVKNGRVYGTIGGTSLKLAEMFAA